MKRLQGKRIAVMLLVLGLLLTACAAQAQELRVDFYDMGKADAMLITTPSGVRILIDTGTNKGGKALVERFEKEGINAIDTLIITHYDKDHVGGADKILEEIAVRQVIMPVYNKESKQHTQFMEALDAHREIATFPMEIESDMKMQSDDGVSMSLTAAHKKSYGKDEENDFSLAVRLEYGETKFFFAGDAEAPRQKELLDEGDVKCDVLKVPYHGRLVSMSEKFLTEASPKIAYITDDEEDPASPDVIAMLETLGAQVYSSREDGDVTVVSDGENVKVLK
ncbi:MAG: MBL fold metallo-hydrolase [Clostridia bacterium]|nr:MBL fold metallo-hydrolase [Clostridia bacterium]